MKRRWWRGLARRVEAWRSTGEPAFVITDWRGWCEALLHAGDYVVTAPCHVPAGMEVTQCGAPIGIALEDSTPAANGLHEVRIRIDGGAS